MWVTWASILKTLFLPRKSLLTAPSPKPRRSRQEGIRAMKKQGALPSAEPFPGIISGFRVQDLGFRISDSGLRIEDLWLVDPLQPPRWDRPSRNLWTPRRQKPLQEAPIQEGFSWWGCPIWSPGNCDIRPNSTRHSITRMILMKHLFHH